MMSLLTAISRRIAGPVTLTRVMNALQARGAMPIPRDEPRVRVDGPDIQRVLLLGGVVAGSHGVTSHHLGMAGHLARMLYAVTRRGVEVHVLSVLPGSARQLTRELTADALAPFDAIVTFVGGVEARSLWSDQRWRRAMGGLLDRLTLLAPQTPLVVVGVSRLPEMIGVPKALFARVNRSTDRLNRVTRELVSEYPNARFMTVRVPLPADGDALLPSFADGASAITPVVSRVLIDRAFSRSGAMDPEAYRRNQEALDLLAISDGGFKAHYDRAADYARELLGAAGAVITFIDSERHLIKGSAGLPTADVPRWLEFCDTNIRTRGGIVIEEISADSPLAGHPWVAGEPGVRSYAGVPLLTPAGEAVGALCMVCTVPRTFDELDFSLLQQLAGRLQTLLWSDGEPTMKRVGDVVGEQ
jgi:GAF domain-containing protein